MKKNMVLLFVVMMSLSFTSLYAVGSNPVFTETRPELTYYIGDAVPTWLDYVTATDVEDGVIVPVVDATDFDNTATGRYEVIYTATDTDLNATVHTMYVTVAVNDMSGFLDENLDVATDVPGLLTSGITSISNALIASVVVAFAVGLALVMRGFGLIPRIIKSLRR